MRMANSPRRRHRIIRNSRCTRCWIDSASSARDVEILGRPAPHGREMLVSEAMRPSNATAQWHQRLAEPDVAEKISDGMTDLAVIEAANPEMEALAIAVAMREARHLNKSAALVTPDRALARRVMAALGRWNLAFDDSGGDALMDTPAGIFARLAAEAAATAARAADAAGAAEASAVPARAARRAHCKRASRRWNWRCCAAHVRSRAARACAGLRALPPRACQARRGESLLTARLPSRGAGCKTTGLTHAQALIARLHSGAGAARDPRSSRPHDLPNWRGAIAKC